MKKFILLFVSINLIASIEKFHLTDNWYPSDKLKLQEKLNELEKKAKEKYNAYLNKTDVRAAIIPHAGIDYSGVVSSAIFAQLDKNLERVIILATDHSGLVENVAIPDFDEYEIPTGKLIIDTSITDKLSKNKNFKINNSAFKTEHSLEIELPFIKKYLTHAKIVPLIVGEINCEKAKEIAQELKKFIDKKTLVLVSSDFIHYGKRFNFTPFKNNIVLNIKQLNSEAIQLIENENCKKFQDFTEKTKATICGRNSIKILLELLEIKAFGAVEPRLIAYDMSSYDEKADSVSYVGMLFTEEKLENLPIEKQLTEQEKNNLYQFSENTLNNLFKDIKDKELYNPILSFGLTRQHGAFVTLRKDHQLRGCIGQVIATKPLWEIVKEVTKDAAFNDPRFEPLKKDELNKIDLEVSVLADPKKINSYKEIVVGKHGIILSSNNKSALFLPEVATEFKWDLPTTLTELSKKAGLNENAWKEKGAEFKVFSALNIIKT